MYDALQIAATGMQAQQASVDAIAHNMANVATPGYKRTRIAFADLVTGSPGAGSAASPDGALATRGAAVVAQGAGVGIAAVARLFDAGELRQTDAALDIAISGDGFLEVTMPDGSRAWTRGGTLRVDDDGQLVTQRGLPLKPGIVVPADTQKLVIGPDGKVTAASAARPTPIELGQLQLVRFMNPGALTPAGDGLYRAGDTAGEPIGGRAGEDAMGTVRQGFLEGSNVKLVDEMVSLMVAQRAYEASVKVVQAADEMLGLVNTLRK